MRTTLIFTLIYTLITVDASTTCGSVKRAYQTSGCCNQSEITSDNISSCRTTCPVEAMTASASFTTVISNDTIPFIVNRMTTRLGTVMASDMGSMILMIAPLLPSACSEVPEVCEPTERGLRVVWAGFWILLQGNVGKYASDIPYELIADTIDETVDERRRKLSTRSTVYGVWKKSVKKMLTVIRRLKRRAIRVLAGDDEETLPTCYDLEDAYYTAREDDDEEGDDDDDAIFAIIEEALSFILDTQRGVKQLFTGIILKLSATIVRGYVAIVQSDSFPIAAVKRRRVCQCRAYRAIKSTICTPLWTVRVSVSDTEDMESLEYIDPMIMLADHVIGDAYAASSSNNYSLGRYVHYRRLFHYQRSSGAALAQSSVLSA